jgi:hypothetical protein
MDQYVLAMSELSASSTSFISTIIQTIVSGILSIASLNVYIQMTRSPEPVSFSLFIELKKLLIFSNKFCPLSELELFVCCVLALLKFDISEFNSLKMPNLSTINLRFCIKKVIKKYEKSLQKLIR